MRFPRKLFLLYLTFCLGLGIVWLRVGQMQVVDGASWTQRARELRRRTESLEAPRGEIVDSDGVVLAEDVPIYQLTFHGWEWLRRARTRCTECGTIHFHYVKRPPRRCACQSASRGRPFAAPASPSTAATLERLPFSDLAPLEDSLDLPRGELRQRAERRLAEVDRLVASYGERLHREGVDRFLLDDKMLLREEDLLRRPFLLLSDVPADVTRLVSLDEDGRFRGFGIRTALRRRYPLGDFAPQLLGFTSVVRDEAEYDTLRAEHPAQVTRTTRVGRSGVERAFNWYLSGIPGYRIMELDGNGLFTETIEKRPPQRGQRLELTLSSQMSRMAEGTLAHRANPQGYYPQGQPSGAFVMLDAETGAVLAWAELPRYDPNEDLAKLFDPAFAHAAPDRESRSWVPRFPLPAGLDEAMWRDQLVQPVPSGRSRVSQVAVEPGSTFKPIIALGMLSTGKPLPFARYTCRLADSGYPGCHNCGSVDLVRALARSCNRYFAFSLRDGGLWGTYRTAVAAFVDRMGFGRSPNEQMPEWGHGLWARDWIDFPVAAAVERARARLEDANPDGAPELVLSLHASAARTVAGDPDALARVLAEVANRIQRESRAARIAVTVRRERVVGRYVDLRFELRSASAPAWFLLAPSYDARDPATWPADLRRAYRRVSAMGGDLAIEGPLALRGTVAFTVRFDKRIGRTDALAPPVVRGDDGRNVAIGQGPVLATPLQMARAMAVIANGGRLVTPHVVATVGGEPDRYPPEDLGLRPEHLAQVREGMQRAVTEGTARNGGWHAVAATVYGKTGTAQVGGSWRPWPSEGESGEPWHHWFAGFAEAPGRPTVAFACVLHARTESAAGHTAVPTVGRILRAWFGG